MDFEFDKRKSQSNKKKHGIDFEEAMRLWEDEKLVIIPAKFLDEPRYILIGKSKRIYWTAVYTYRKEKIRIISVRRSRENEKEIYKS